MTERMDKGTKEQRNKWTYRQYQKQYLKQRTPFID